MTAGSARWTVRHQTISSTENLVERSVRSSRGRYDTPRVTSSFQSQTNIWSVTLHSVVCQSQMNAISSEPLSSCEDSSWRSSLVKDGVLPPGSREEMRKSEREEATESRDGRRQALSRGFGAFPRGAVFTHTNNLLRQNLQILQDNKPRV